MATAKPTHDTLKEKYLTTTTISLEDDTNILDQIHGYQHNTNELLIGQLSDELVHQEKLNKMLKSESCKDQIKNIQKFVTTHEKDVVSQLENLEGIIQNLKPLCEENKRLEEEKEDLNEILYADSCVHLAKKMRKIKTLKGDILLFLQNQGIHSPF